MRKKRLEIGDMALLIALCLLLTVVGMLARRHHERRLAIRRRAQTGERAAYDEINDNLDLERRVNRDKGDSWQRDS